MPDIKMKEVFDLLEKANDSGITISMSDNDLSLKFSRKVKVDDVLLSEIKASKEHLLRYFKDYGNGKVNKPAEASKYDGKVIIDGEEYWELAPTQIWWVTENDESAEFKQRAFALIGFIVTGKLDIDVFRRVVTYFVNRHESVRGTYHKFDGRYLMYVIEENSPLFD